MQRGLEEPSDRGVAVCWAVNGGEGEAVVVKANVVKSCVADVGITVTYLKLGRVERIVERRDGLVLVYDRRHPQHIRQGVRILLALEADGADLHDGDESDALIAIVNRTRPQAQWRTRPNASTMTRRLSW